MDKTRQSLDKNKMGKSRQPLDKKDGNQKQKINLLINLIELFKKDHNEKNKIRQPLLKTNASIQQLSK